MTTKILIVDDEATTRKMLKHLIEGLGYSSILASNGNRATEILEDNDDVALVITDMMMPEKDGFELIKWMKMNPKLGAVPVIAVSGIVKLSEIDNVLKTGAERFLPKPLDVTTAKQYINDLLRGPKASSSG